jgi:DNA repair ATPase RecN
MGSNVLQFMNSIEAAIQNVEGLQTIYGKTVETTEHLKSLKEQVEKVNRLLQNAQEVEYAIRDLMEMTDMVTQLTKQIRSAHNQISFEEATLALNMFSQVLVRATGNLKTIYGFVEANVLDPVALAIEKRKMAEEKARMQATADAMKKYFKARGQQRKLLDEYSGQRSSLNPADIAYVATTYAEREVSGMESLFLAASTILGDGYKREKETVSSAVMKVQGIGGYFFTLYYSICAIVGLIGAFKVYSKVQLGEDFGRTTGIWIGSALAAFYLGVLVQAFFF